MSIQSFRIAALVMAIASASPSLAQKYYSRSLLMPSGPSAPVVKRPTCGVQQANVAWSGLTGTLVVVGSVPVGPGDMEAIQAMCNDKSVADTKVCIGYDGGGTPKKWIVHIGNAGVPTYNRPSAYSWTGSTCSL